jgi:hypothetical protein
MVQRPGHQEWGPSMGFSSMTGQPPKSLSLSLAELELSEDGCLTGRPVVLMPGTFNVLCVPGAGNTLFVPETIVVIGAIIVVELCMPGSCQCATQSWRSRLSTDARSL